MTNETVEQYAVLLARKRLLTNVESGLRAILAGLWDVPAQGWPQGQNAPEILQEQLAGVCILRHG